jgi:hypothetical protein
MRSEPRSVHLCTKIMFKSRDNCTMQNTFYTKIFCRLRYQIGHLFPFALAWSIKRRRGALLLTDVRQPSACTQTSVRSTWRPVRPDVASDPVALLWHLLRCSAGVPRVRRWPPRPRLVASRFCPTGQPADRQRPTTPAVGSRPRDEQFDPVRRFSARHRARPGECR